MLLEAGTCKMNLKLLTNQFSFYFRILLSWKGFSAASRSFSRSSLRKTLQLSLGRFSNGMGNKSNGVLTCIVCIAYVETEKERVSENLSFHFFPVHIFSLTWMSLLECVNQFWEFRNKFLLCVYIFVFLFSSKKMCHSYLYAHMAKMDAIW